MGFLNWLLEPFFDLQKKTKVNRKEVDQNYNSEIDYVGHYLRGDYNYTKKKVTKEIKPTIKPTIFRPLTFKEYIGQQAAKDILQKFIVGTRQRKLIFPHTLIHGGAGCGKTTLVKIVANQLKVPIVETITSDITDFEQLKKYLNSANGGILFLDEIHSLDRNNAEKFYTIMEDFSYNGTPIAPFTLVGATTELGEIIRNRKPFFDRFKIIIELESYNNTNLSSIIKQYRKNMFSNDTLNNDIYMMIAENSRGTPRTAIRLLEATIYFNGNIKEVLKSFGIIKDGYTFTDLKLLDYMRKSQTAVGMQSIASYLGTSEANYTFSIEPYLLKTGIIIRTPRGRKITDEGIQLISILTG